MNRKTLARFALLLTFVCGAASASYLDRFSAEKISDSVWVIHGPLELPNAANEGFINNPAFITTPDGVVVIDPGSSVQIGNMVLREIRKVTDQPVIAVFDTHVHGDHWMGNDAIRRAYPDAELYGHAKMITMVKQGEGLTWQELLLNMTDGATGGTRIVNAEKPLNGGETVSLGGASFVIFHDGPAHTPTDIMIHFAPENVLFTGDNVAYERILRIDRGSFKGNIQAIDKGLALAPAHVVPGHGRSGGIEVLRAYHEYLSTLYTEVKRLFEEDLGDFEMKPLIHDKLGKYHDWAGYDEELGKHISNAYLEVEADAF